MIRVMVVEDDCAVMDITCKYVEGVPGFAVVGRAQDGEEAKAMAVRLRPDLLILDIYMPRKSGMDLLAELRAENVPVHAIFLTASDDAAMMARAEELGAADYLVKPVSFERFKASLARCDASTSPKSHHSLR